ncbi:hypothetical protein [Rossellomorea aquimaris]|uniref:hypothetical protein n=1 Tax=Rossellomorea aquimaris TaxID=189382 RepID=UPI0006969E21|nr:hypothetical protein [Rossellomorea aquimaris]
MKKTIGVLATGVLLLTAIHPVTERVKEAQASETMSSGSLQLAEMNDFFAGNQVDKQSYIHSFIPKNSKKAPVVMIPGLGLGANIYESTPDGENGWAYSFADAGHPVYTVDTHDLSSAGLTEEEALASLSRWDSESIWPRWGLGSAPATPYPDGQFPADYFHEFYESIPMQIKDTSAGEATGVKAGGGSRADQQEVGNMIALLERTGPSILLVHSMGGEIGYEVARQRPDLVEGIIAIEPVGSPTDPEEVKEVFADIPYLGVYGDYLESRNQVSRMEAVQETVDLISGYKGKAELIRLTEEGIDGNSHLMMLDKNSEVISEKILQWLKENHIGQS